MKKLGIFSGLLILIVFLYWWTSIFPFYRMSGELKAQMKEMQFEESCLLKVALEEGAIFQKGDLLFAMDESQEIKQLHEIDIHLDSLAIELNQANLKKEQTLEQYAYLQRELAGHGPAEIMDEFLAEVHEWEEKSGQLNAQIVSLQRERKEIERKIETLQKEAPFSGIVLQRFKALDEKVLPHEPVLLVCEKNLWIEAEIPEVLLSKISLDQSAAITIPAYPKKAWDGKISSISPISKAGKLKIRLDCQDLPLRPGLTAEVSIKIR